MYGLLATLAFGFFLVLHGLELSNRINNPSAYRARNPSTKHEQFKPTIRHHIERLASLVFGILLTCGSCFILGFFSYSMNPPFLDPYDWTLITFTLLMIPLFDWFNFDPIWWALFVLPTALLLRILKKWFLRA